jgi:hypothetical protein
MAETRTSNTAPLHARPNIAMAEIVDNAIALMDQYGRDFASQYLIGHGVNFRVIERVLADPQFRRAPKATGRA